MPELSEHLSHLASYNDDEAESKMPASELEQPQSDNLIEDPLEVSAEVLIPDPPDEGVDPNLGTEAHPEGTMETDGSTPDYRALYEQTRAESAGRLNEIAGMRSDRAEANQTIKNIQEMMVEQQRVQAEAEIRAEVEQELAEDEAMYGPEVMADPTVQYLTDQIEKNSAQVEQMRQAQEHRVQSVNEQAQTAASQQAETKQVQDAVAHSEAEFVKAQPDYYQAFDYATKKRAASYVNRGYDQVTAEKMVVQEVQFLAKEQTQMGRSPAKAAYDVAVEWGWTPQQAAQQPSPAVAQGVADYNAMLPNVDKLKAGVAQGRGSGEMAGTAGQSRAGVLTREEFFATVPANIRMQVLADADKFEELGKTGSITVDW